MISGAKIQNSISINFGITLVDEFSLTLCSRIFWCQNSGISKVRKSKSTFEIRCISDFAVNDFFLSAFREGYHRVVCDCVVVKAASLMLDLTIIYAGSRQSHPRYNIANFMWRTRETPRAASGTSFMRGAAF